ncbi:MAG: YgaP-like transmembrane domain [Candidatus Methylomirabilia bacterium]
MTAAKNIGAVERWVRLVGGGLLILLGVGLAGWAGWVSGLAGLALVLTSAIRY